MVSLESLGRDDLIAPQQLAQVAASHPSHPRRARQVAAVRAYELRDPRPFPAVLRVLIGQRFDGLVALLGPQAAKKGLVLRSEVSPDVPPRLVGDPQRLRQVLTNLVGNGSKFTDKGEIRIEVSRADSSDQSRPVGLRFAVVDTGIGIAEADLARIFEAFTQVDGSATRRFGGTGLGLAIVHSLATRLSGTVHAGHAPEGGARFTVRLPRA